MDFFTNMNDRLNVLEIRSHDSLRFCKFVTVAFCIGALYIVAQNNKIKKLEEKIDQHTECA